MHGAFSGSQGGFAPPEVPGSGSHSGDPIKGGGLLARRVGGEA